MGPPRCRNRFGGVIAATALIVLAAGSAQTVVGVPSPATFAASDTLTTGSWTDNAAGNAEDRITNSRSDSLVVPPGSTSYDWLSERRS
jgi:hypothetical protein